MTESIDLDHVALAFERAFDGLTRYRGDLGGAFVGGAIDPGFYWGQVQYANGMRVELLEANDVERDDFLERFVKRNGPGPHHFTFKVPDIHQALDRVRSAGFEPARVNLDSDVWKEVFLHPKQAHGIVIQMAQPAGEGDMFGEDRLPMARSKGNVTLDRVVHLVADLDSAVGLFAGVLDGRATPAGESESECSELEWPGGGVIRLCRPRTQEEHAWLGDRIGRLHRLEFSLSDPASVPGARALSQALSNAAYEISPEENYGTRLRLMQISN